VMRRRMRLGILVDSESDLQHRTSTSIYMSLVGPSQRRLAPTVLHVQ
jgi:hypothetical protein